MNRRSTARWLVGSLLAVSTVSCGEQSVMVASLEAVDAANGGEASVIDGGSRQDGNSEEQDAAQDGALLPMDAGTRACSPTLGCPSGQFCVKSSCNAPFGYCESPPSFCGNEHDPVCGCDGVAYWNDCLRQRSGVAASTMGPCPPHLQLPCDGQGNPPCPMINELCAKLDTGSSGSCDPDFPGVCWVLPPTCPEDAGGAWIRCGGGPPSCTDLCDAIRSGEPYELSNNTCP